METKKVGQSNQLQNVGKADKSKVGATGSDLASSMPVAGGAIGRDNVKVSQKARDTAEAIRKAKEIATNTPDVREDKVNEIKRKIQDGTYQMDSGDTADGMMHEAILEFLSDPKNRDK